MSPELIIVRPRFVMGRDAAVFACCGFVYERGGAETVRRLPFVYARSSLMGQVLLAVCPLGNHVRAGSAAQEKQEWRSASISLERFERFENGEARRTSSGRSVRFPRRPGLRPPRKRCHSPNWPMLETSAALGW